MKKKVAYIFFAVCLSFAVSETVSAEMFESINACTQQGGTYRTACDDSRSETSWGPVCPNPNDRSSCPFVCCGTQQSLDWQECQKQGGTSMGQCGEGLEITKINGRGCCKSAKHETSTSSFSYTPLEAIPGEGTPTDFPAYLKALYNFTLASVGIAALLMAIIGGFYYVTSAGNSSRVEKGKELITDALLGIAVAFLSWLVLYVINPDLVNVNLDSLLKLELPEGGEMTMQQSPTQQVLSSKGKEACQKSEFTSQVQASASKYGVDAKILQSIIVGGESCNPTTSNRGACGYGQQMPDIRAWCGLTGSASDTCSAMQNNTALSLDCAAKLIADNNKLGCDTASCSEVARCYNAGSKKTCAQTQDHYCDRVCAYYTSTY